MSSLPGSLLHTERQDDAGDGDGQEDSAPEYRVPEVDNWLETSKNIFEAGGGEGQIAERGNLCF